MLQVLCIQGFLACRKHADRIILLVDMMSTSGCPAFKAGPRAIQALRKRFHLNLTEAQVRLLSSASLVLPMCSPCEPAHLQSSFYFAAKSSCAAFLTSATYLAFTRRRLNPCPGLQCVEVMLSLISDSLDAWRTRQYDYYQRVLNGIL